MAGIDSFNTILQEAGVTLNDADKEIVNKNFDKVELLNEHSTPNRINNIPKDVSNAISTLLGNNPQLRPYGDRILDSFVESAKEDKTKELLNNKFKEIKDRYPQLNAEWAAKDHQQLGSIITDLTTLSKEANLVTKIGPKNAKEFADKVDTIGKNYAKATANEKAGTLLGDLNSLKEWSEVKEKESKSPILSKIGNIITSYAMAVGSWLSGDHEGAKKHKLNAAQTIQELTQSKQISQVLGAIGEKPQSWREKVTQQAQLQKHHNRDR